MLWVLLLFIVMEFDNGVGWLVFVSIFIVLEITHGSQIVIVSAKIIDSRKDRKYILIIPFWLDTMIEALICMLDINLGVVFSIQIMSRRVDAAFWLSISVFLGEVLCIIVGKNPSIVENVLVLEVRFSFRL
jgi:hypothetical protein